MKKIFLFFMVLMFVILLASCGDCKKTSYDELIWNNNEAIYVVINDEYANDIFKNIDKSFEKYQYKKAYVVNKKTNDNLISNLKILFIINDNINEFVMNLKGDQRIKYYEICKDLPYESIDNRYLECENNIINVGDQIKITLSGTSDIYMQPFLDDSFYVTPINYDKNSDLSYFKKN